MSFTKAIADKARYNWEDVKQPFWLASQEISLGELVHDNLFGLFEAMSAIEIMDPKMDAGMVCNRKRKALQFPQAIEAGKVKISGFTDTEVLGIIDELTACFVTWLDGHSLVQSVFICMYCHNPYIIEDVVLKAMCIASLKLVDIVRNVCTKAKVFEEEDFQPMTYGFNLATDVTELRVSGMLREAEEEITKKIKHQNETNELTNTIDTCKAIKNRLKFWRAFYCALLAFEKPECVEIQKCREHLDGAKSAISSMKSTLDLGVQPDRSLDYYIPGFDTLVNQRLLPPSFPRQTEIFPREIAVQYLQELIERLQRLCDVNKCTSLHTILEFLNDYSKSVPCVLSRSLLQLNILQSNQHVFGKYPLPDMIRESIKLFNGAPGVADLSPLTSPDAKSIVQNFVLKCVKPITLIVEAYGHNRARQREKLGALLEELGELQSEADKADQELHVMLQTIDSKRQHLACFESWVLFQSLTVMIQHICLGFELELFNPHEFHYVYWYLDYLFVWSNNCLKRAEMLLGLQEQYVDKKCGKKEKKKRNEILKSCSDQIKEHKSLRLVFTGMKDICLGNIKAYEGFNKDGKIVYPEIYFDNEKIRFERRFMSFQAIDTHQSATYKDYKDMTNPRYIDSDGNELVYTSKEFYDQAMTHYQSAMEVLQYVEKIDVEGERLMKVAKTNFVVMKLAASGHKKDSSSSPGWDFGVHQIYPVIRLT